MRFTALRDDVLAAVQRVQYSSDTRGMMPILSGVKIESEGGELIFHSTNLESYTTTTGDVKVDEEGVCVVNLKIFMDILKESREEKLTVSIAGNEMVIEGGSTVFKLLTMPPEDFPSAPDVNIPVIKEIEAGVFTEAVLKVSKAASRDEKRPTLLGILMDVKKDELHMVSTDSYRLAIKKFSGDFEVLEESKYIIPSAAMANLARIAEKTGKIDIYRDENGGQIRFDVKKSNYMIRLIEGKFPKYDQFIPENMDKKVTMEKSEILGALKRIGLIGDTIKLKINDEGVTVASESREVGEGSEQIAAEYGGEEISVAFNHRFLEDGLVSIDGEKVILAISEALKPGVIREKEKEDFMYIIMPIRL